MASAVVLAWDETGGDASPEAVVRTLATLVPAAIEGLVRDVTLAGRTDLDLARIADHAGCALVQDKAIEAAWVSALQATREPLVFVIQAGALPDPGYVDEIISHLADRDPESRALVLRFEPRSRLDFWPKPAALLASRAALSSHRSGSLRDLSKSVGRLTALRSQARRVA